MRSPSGETVAARFVPSVTVTLARCPLPAGISCPHALDQAPTSMNATIATSSARWTVRMAG